MTKAKWTAVITVTVIFVALCAFGVIWLKNSNERLNKLLENADYQVKTEATETVLIPEPEETTATERKTLTEKAKEPEQTDETIPQETEPPPNEKEEEIITTEETEENPITEEQEDINPITDIIEVPGWQDYDDYGKLLPPYKPEETAITTYPNETLIIQMEGELNE